PRRVLQHAAQAALGDLGLCRRPDPRRPAVRCREAVQRAGADRPAPPSARVAQPARVRGAPASCRAAPRDEELPVSEHRAALPLAANIDPAKTRLPDWSRARFPRHGDTPYPASTFSLATPCP